MSVIVLGSLNMDLVIRTPRLPQPGETITGYSFVQVPGGKGGNQAVAAARLGANTHMVGRVGNDGFGATLYEQMHASGVDVSGITRDETVPSGIAVITIDDTAQNRIIVLPGANANLGPKELDYLRQLLSTAKVLLLQFEVPIPVVHAAAVDAAEHGVAVVLDPAPVPPEGLPAELYGLASIITPNETEAASLVGFPLDSDEAIVKAGKFLRERGPANVIIKLGGRGLFWTDGRREEFRAAFPVTPVDTVAAGDAFNGALAVALSEGKSLDEAINWGLAAGAIAVTREGAQPAMPEREEILALLNQYNIPV